VLRLEPFSIYADMIRILVVALTLLSFDSVVAQDQSLTADDVAAELAGEATPDKQDINVAKAVQVNPENPDERIQTRLQEIMEATGWFDTPAVTVDRGVAFLSGTADSLKHQDWAEATAMTTADVVAVVNRIAVAEKPLWNFGPAVASLKQLGREFTSILPLLLIAVAVVVFSYFAAIAGARITRWLTRQRIDSKLLREVTGNVVAVLIFIVGTYVALRASGLTRLAVTLLGGTGLVGLALGFAFRDIAENYLASILISLNHPFRVVDLIEVEGMKGFVRKVTTRGTILNTFAGNQVQLPNSTVYKGKITNVTATPLSRQDVTVGIGFDDSATEAQEIIMDVLRNHAAVVADPAPIVIVESLGSATVNLRVFYWFDQTKHSPLKVSSSVIRLSKQKLTEAEITMPDEARELVFPQGVPVRMLEPTAATAVIDQLGPGRRMTDTHDAQQHKIEQVTKVGEGDLSSEQGDVMRATANDSTVEGEVNLIQ
jgi:small-conductance mechanosensitive channel